ncbi:helix-turn-helix domain-containing protein [Lacrimispora saccharolytica]|nr:helix-turn-helix domain-containing protein [Lacrimispora saccharolytica]
MSIRGVGRPRVHRPENWQEVTLRWHRGKITAVAAMKLLDLPKSTFYRFLAEDNAGADMLELGLLWDRACRVAEQQEVLEPIIVPVTDFYYNKKRHVHGTIVVYPDALQDPERKYSLMLLQSDDSRAEIWHPYTLYPGTITDPSILRWMSPIPAPILRQIQEQLKAELNKLLQIETEV